MNAVRSLPVIDGLLAATAAHFRLVLATRNLADFPHELDKINPWDFAV
jgi:predicted nucleic acid-binding protein